MSDPLHDLEVLVLDCQAGGATPAHGDLLELGWATAGAEGLRTPARSHWIVPRTERRVSRAVRELTGWSERCVDEAIDERAAWHALRADVDELRARGQLESAPTLIHFARFELSFLRDLQLRVEPDAAFPLDVICLHSIATRLFPDLPRRNIRALAGHLGHAPQLIRRAGGHVEATAFIWHAMLPRLRELGVSRWDELARWLAEAPAGKRPARRMFPLERARRTSLPDAPGVYRFVRRNGDVIYVGKASSLKRRVASHFSSGARATERGLEMLTQVDDIHVTETHSILEAALLEVDEIKRIDPPYNVQLRRGERSAWFAAADLRVTAPTPDAAHRIGPLPSARSLLGLAGLIALCEGAAPTPGLRAMALAVPAAFVPDEALFGEGWRVFADEHLHAAEPSAARRMDRGARALWLARGRSEVESASEEAAPTLWDLARVRRRLERNLVQTGLVMRRARWLSLLADADVAFRERGAKAARLLVIAHGQLAEQVSLEAAGALASLAPRPPRTRLQRQSSFDAATYDRLRVLATELRRVHDDGGEVALRFASHTFAGPRLTRLMAMV